MCGTTDLALDSRSAVTAKVSRLWQRILAVILVTGLPCADALAGPPDLTLGEGPGDSISFNMGPTGMRGWVYHAKSNSGESRQILVTAVAAGSPADGILAANDVILGADGTGANPVNFSSDARRTLADAITDAEARDPATLKLIRWRAGASFTVTLTLRTMGAYSATAPYDCPKSTKILTEGLAYLMGTNALGQPVAQETAGRYSFGTLSLLAANDLSIPGNAARMARAETEALALIPSAATMAQMLSDVRDTASPWERGHTLIVLAEYYLVTGDTRVMPAIEAYAVNIAKNQSLFGTLGHIFAEKNPDGSNNGPMGGQYGPVNSSGVPCFLGVLLARQCGLSDPNSIALLDASIERTSRFFTYYAGRGAIPYGEHEAYWQGHETNGKSGLAALCFELQSNRVAEGQFFAKMATASTAEREIGHTGTFFNYLWAPLGAATGGEEAAASYFRRTRWHYELARRWDGGFDYDCLYGEGPNSGAQYNGFRMSTAALLTYALPLRKLHLTGRSHNLARWLGDTDVAEAEFADRYDATTRDTSELVTDLGSWSPTVQIRAAEQLATRSIDSTTLAQITSLATDAGGHSRVGACYTLGKINNSSTAAARAATLAGLLTDPENQVRFMAAEAMRYLPQANKMTHLNTILDAAASTGAPLLPWVEEDPLHFAHSKLSTLLFYGGNAYGPKGVIYNSLSGVDRSHLYPAIQAVAQCPIGFARGNLYFPYKQLTAADVDALAETLVESVQYRAPADKMFSAGCRRGGLEILEQYGIAEGVPLSLVYMLEDGRSDAYKDGLATLLNYAGGCNTVQPDPGVIGFCQALLSGSNAAAAQAVLDAIAADSNPAPLTPFKSIQSVTVDAPSLTLPANQTMLHAGATDHAQGDLVYTWRKVRGAGSVSFTPNGTPAAKDCAIQFDKIPGQYLFEVTVSDQRGFTEVSDTVAVTLYDTGGNLPANNPPTAIPQAVTATPSSVTPITLSGTDPESYPLVFTVTSQPAHGSLTGTAPDLNYTPEGGYTGSDSFDFQVMDSEGQISSAAISISVNASSVELYVYEPFDYATGGLTGNAGGTGMNGAWANGPDGPGLAAVFDEATATTPVVRSEGNLSWDGVVDNLPTLPSTGARYVALAAGTSDKFEAYRPLARSAGAMAGADGVLWMSSVWHAPTTNGFGSGVTILLSTDPAKDRGRTIINTNGGHAIGVSGYYGATWNSKLNPTVFDGGIIANATAGGTLNAAGDNIVILKFEFSSTGPDTVRAYSFLEAATMNETIFNANAVFTSSVIDESTLNLLTFAQNRGSPAIDEIRIGNSFASVIGVQGPPPDTNSPTLAAADIVDDRNGEPVTQNTSVSYSVTFSEEMAPATVEAADFGNAGTAAITINSIIHPLPCVFVVRVTPVTTGDLQLRVNPAAVLTDVAGNPLETSLPIADDTVITVNPLIVTVPDVADQPQASAESTITSAGLVIGTVTSQYQATVLTGNTVSQSPAAGTGVSPGTPVDLVVSLGPVPDHVTWQAQYPDADLSDSSADYDGDGLSNGEEYIWGLDPTRASSCRPIAVPLDKAGGTFRYSRRDPALTHLTYTVWTSNNLKDWSEDIGAQQAPDAPGTDGNQTVEVTLSPGLLANPSLFARVRAN